MMYCGRDNDMMEITKSCFDCLHFDGDIEGPECPKRKMCLGFARQRNGDKKYWESRVPVDFIEEEEMTI